MGLESSQSCRSSRIQRADEDWGIPTEREPKSSAATVHLDHSGGEGGGGERCEEDERSYLPLSSLSVFISS